MIIVFRFYKILILNCLRFNLRTNSDVFHVITSCDVFHLIINCDGFHLVRNGYAQCFCAIHLWGFKPKKRREFKSKKLLVKGEDPKSFVYAIVRWNGARRAKSKKLLVLSSMQSSFEIYSCIYFWYLYSIGFQLYVWITLYRLYTHGHLNSFSRFNLYFRTSVLDPSNDCS